MFNVFWIGMNFSISPINSLPKAVNPVACCSNNEKVQKHSEDNSLNKLAIKDFHCTESEVTLRGSCICSEYLKHGSSPTNSLTPVSVEVYHNLTVESSRLRRMEFNRTEEPWSLNALIVFLPSACTANYFMLITIRCKVTLLIIMWEKKSVFPRNVIMDLLLAIISEVLIQEAGLDFWFPTVVLKIFAIIWPRGISVMSWIIYRLL